MSLSRRWFPILLAGVFVTLMVGMSRALACPELLFPEMAAILCGGWIQPRQAWNVDRPRMVLLMAFAATLGLASNLWVPLPLAARVILGYAICATTMNAVGADMTPMLSAAILPMLLGTDSWIYPLAVVGLVLVVCLGQVWLEGMGVRESIDYRTLRLPWREALPFWGKRLAVFGVVAVPAYLTGHTFLAVPPLIVAYTELTRPDFTLRARPQRAWAALAGAGAIGAVARAAVDGAGVPASLAAALGFVLLVLLWDRTRAWMPPAGAAFLLALLAPVPNPLVYAVEVAVGAALWTLVALVLFDGVRPSWWPGVR